MPETPLFPSFRTDIADEAYELSKNKAGFDNDGLESVVEKINAFDAVTLKIKTNTAAEKIGKAQGNYTTFSVGNLALLDSEEFESACLALSSKIREYIPCSDSILVAGLGNRDITADSVGHHAVSSILITRHLKTEAQALYNALSLKEMSAILPDVLGNTGIEAAHIIKGAVDIVKPSTLIVIDALCAKSIKRLYTTVQICDSGITPGSGVSNHRHTISKETVGVPVVSIGIPTVVSASTIAKEYVGADKSNSSRLSPTNNEYYVTSKDCDSQILAISKLTGLAINLAIQDKLSFHDIQNLLIR